jgi:hypothetical protein
VEGWNHDHPFNLPRISNLLGGILAKLVIYEDLEGEETIFEDFELSTHRILIGSSEDNNLVLDMPDIDPTHASMELRNDHWVIQDLGGPGGTMVNNEQVDGPHRLHHNDLIELNSLKMRFYENDLTGGEVDSHLLEDDFFEEDFAPEVVVSGRIWFGTIAGITLVVIFIILLTLVVLDYFSVLKIIDLLPLGLGE